MALTDAQLVLLSAASQHDDHLLPRPAKLVGAAMASVEATLIKAGLAASTPVRADQPSWRQEEDGAPVGLRITPFGLRAINVESEPQLDGITAKPAEPEPPHAAQSLDGDAAPLPRTFRSGSKAAQLVSMLSLPEGAGLDALVTALGWQPHTVRAALTRLRQGGFALCTKKNQQGKTLYRIAAVPDLPSPADVTTGATA